MKKSLFGFALFLALVFPCLNANAADQAGNMETIANPAGNPVDQFTGEYWLKTTPECKEAYLFGLDSAIAVENTINSKRMERAAKSGKKPVYTLSPFEKGWMRAFTGVTRKDIVAMIDAWYADNPKNLDKPVLAVIWYNIIEPRLQTARPGK